MLEYYQPLLYGVRLDLKKILLTDMPDKNLFIKITQEENLSTPHLAFAQEITTTTTTTTTIDASTLTNKRGEAFLPVADEWALGISANPFFHYLGNFFHGEAVNNQTPTFSTPSNPANNIALFGKLVKDANTAYRLRVNLTSGTRTNKAVILQNEINADPFFPAFTQDWQKVNTTAIVIAPGIEKRRGSTRLQGVYGGELVLGFNNSTTKYEYGNPMSTDFNVPNTTNFGNNIAGNSRVVEQKQGSNFLVGARGFIGVEYFFSPKISIGGEFGLMLGFETQNKGSMTTETWDGAELRTRETKTDTFVNDRGLSSLGIGLNNLGGSINLLFYF